MGRSGAGGHAAGRAAARAGAAVLLLLAAAGPAPAGRPLFQRGPLCRDSKGLAKPCAPGELRQARAQHAEQAAKPGRGADQPAAGANPRSAAGRETAAARRPARRPLFGRGPLCRDSKGLAKPCP